MTRFRWVSVLVAATILAGCTPSFKQDTEVVQQTEDAEEVETAHITSRQLSENYYRTLTPYKESASRGLIVSNIYTKYDIKEAENGLMRISQNVFDTEKYFFQEGQQLSANTVSYWLARENQTTDQRDDLQGLNPSSLDANGKELEATIKAVEAPVYLAHIVEQNYLTLTDDNKVRLSGMSVGLALNSVYYYQKERYGEYFEEPIPNEKLEAAAIEIAEEVVARLRMRSELADIPIVIGLYKQQPRNSIVPGTYFAYNVVDGGKSALGEWQKINEAYVTFPMSSPADIYREANKSFQYFKQEIDKYFSNFTSVIGTGFYQNNQLQNLEVEIPIQFYGTTEIIGFTQYLTDVMLKQLPKDVTITVSVTSVNGPEVLIKKERDSDKPFVHIYE
ncbi:CamS family sex pheromone protein [Metasolibacillus meyeri]|uniref:CamS family sex pheromone protein n=1 Tax=Metasolibacillus meyeri TaxID=1071052 RepID=A0AAW9NLL6_9BACL|nr:CamS family sex pheromone protein [Metasolibacillus meyeri]MEC1179764.1 CamS family sex pheromone protein [Metasolibacillus meyeri]